MRDRIVDRLVIVDPHVATTFNDSHVVLLIGYLNITGLTSTRLPDFNNVNLD